MPIQTKKTTLPKTPKLRFPGFDGAWEEKQLGDVCDYRNGGAFENYLSDNGKYYLITLNSISIDGKLKHDHKKVDHADWYLNKDDLVMVLSDVAHGNFLGLTDLIPEDSKYVLNQRMGLLRRLDPSVNPVFLKNYINTRQKYFKLNGQGSSQQNLSKGDILKFKIFLPNPDEQDKVANFLVTIDEWIQNLRAQTESLEAYKKGMMQKLFSQEIRFKDENGKDFPAWEEKRLGDIADVIMGQSPESEAYNTLGVGKYLIQGNADIFGRETKPRNWTTQTTKECKVGDVIMTVRAPVGYVARSLHDACIGRGVCAIRNKPVADINFIYQYLLFIEKRWIKLEQGSTFTAVNTQDVKKFKLLVPSSLEQKMIADFLTSLDNLIESKQQQITEAETWKTGLMQQLFI